MMAVDDNAFTIENRKSVGGRGPLSHRHQDGLLDFCDRVLFRLTTIDQDDRLATIIRSRLKPRMDGMNVYFNVGHRCSSGAIPEDWTGELELTSFLNASTSCQRCPPGRVTEIGKPTVRSISQSLIDLVLAMSETVLTTILHQRNRRPRSCLGIANRVEWSRRRLPSLAAWGSALRC